MTANLTPAQVAGVQQWVTDRVTEIIDNHQGLYDAVYHAVAQALDTVEPHPVSPTVYRNRLIVAAGDAVAEILRGELELVPQPMRLLLEELLDFSDRTQWALIGEHYAGDHVALNSGGDK